MPPAGRGKPYHHGDLRRALVDAGEVELAERGLAGFSLRRVSARVGVSHTAPAHHFGDVAGLIAALAERGFRRLLDCMRARQQTAPTAPYEQLVAAGLGYLDFALAHPALFRLIFTMPRGASPDPAVMAAGEAAYMHLARSVASLHGAEPLAHPCAHEQVMACWTRAHGFAELMLAGHLDAAAALDPARREAMFRQVFDARIGP
jgi:AcrR family transcriptional regulator